MPEKEPKMLHFKVILLGKSAVGKSSLLNRYTRQLFSEEYDATIGVEFGSRTIMMQNDVSVKLMIWDTAGQQSFRSIIRTYYRNVGTVFLVYDICDKDSLKELRHWITEAREYTEEGTVFMLVGNKEDMRGSREVSKEQAAEFVKEHRLDAAYECSARSNSGVDEVFRKAADIMVVRKLVQHIKYEELRHSGEKSLRPQPQAARGCEC